MMQKRIPSLDGLRAVAIGLVLVSHLAGARHFFSMHAVGTLGDVGNLGVRLFFVISGFLITRLLLKEFATTQRAAGVLVGVVLVVPVLRVVAYMASPSYEFIADTGFEGVCDALAIGCLLAMAMRRLLRVEWVARALVGRAFPLIFVAIWIATNERDHPTFFWLLCVPFLNV